MTATENSSENLVQLGQAIAAYISTLPPADREATSRELSRFARWIGADVPVRRLTPTDIGRYQEGFPVSSVDLNLRLEPVKIFLTQLKTKKVTDINLGAQVRLRRTTSQRSNNSRPEAETVPMTEEGFAALKVELERLEKDVRPKVTQELTKAAADKDFRENAPYDAAKQQLSQVQGRINDIRSMLSAADIRTADSDEFVDLGMTVVLKDLSENEDISFTVVGQGEVNVREGRISGNSPLGHALMNRRPGDIVEVSTPSGTQTYRVETIQRRRTAGAAAS
ncbi:MAG: transcription elongation factor GreA [Chloroflexi bacterium]|nr:transcription elongation factor GreA [Chloroflexota bacterium]